MLSEASPRQSIHIHHNGRCVSTQIRKIVLVVNTLVTKSLHDGDTKKSPMVALEETGARKFLAMKTVGSTCVHH